MKQKYVKPAMMLEQFSLSQNIAKTCGDGNWKDNTIGKPTHGDFDVCKWHMGNITLWSQSLSCDIEYDGSDYGAACLHNPSGDNAMFAS